MKIGILTYHRARNYGAFLQAVCLCSRLNQEDDIEAEIIDYDMESAHEKYLYRQNPLSEMLHFRKHIFVKQQQKAFVRGIEKIRGLLSSEGLISNDIGSFESFVQNKYDIIISGSDEVWRIKKTRGFPNPYFLPGNLGARKFSYAACARMDFDVLPQEQHEELRKYLEDYEFVSVRDTLTYTTVASEGIPRGKMMISCDPSFLYDFEDKNCTIQELLKGKCVLNPNKKNLVLAGVNKETANSIVSQSNNEYNIISTYNRRDGCINIPDLDPLEWRLLISKADVVVTSLFHGVCFSVANNTPFVAVGTKEKKSKIKGLLFSTELEDNYIDAENVEETDWPTKFTQICNSSNYREFVLRQRKDFSIFLKALRGENVERDILRKNYCTKTHPVSYAVKHKDENVRSESRSGGVFSSISDYVLDNNGVVYGCILNEQLQAIHIRATTKSKRDLMRGSKYVQSNIGDVFEKVKKDLQGGLLVLFSGTSCQVDGLKKYLCKDYDNLILVDILCLGVPSGKVLNSYIKWIEGKNGKCTNINFRNKREYGWQAHVETLTCEKGIVNSRIYATLFAKHLIIRPCCYECPYKREWHPGNITLGDFWEVKNVCPQFNDNKGVSLVLVNDEKGEQIFDCVRSNLIYHRTKFEYSTRESMLEPAHKPKNRTDFWQDYYNKDFTYITKKYVNNSIEKRLKRLMAEIIRKQRIRKV